MSYIVGHPIKHPADFYGRLEQATRFFEIIGGRQAQSVSILGVRRAGKRQLSAPSHAAGFATHGACTARSPVGRHPAAPVTLARTHQSSDRRGAVHTQLRVCCDG